MTETIPQPADRGEVTLRDVTGEDLPIFYEHQMDPLATQMAAFASRERDAFMAHWTKILANSGIIKKTIRCDGLVAGNISCFEQLGEREVGYWLGREFWGKGIATRALSEFLGQVSIRPLFARVAKHNLGSKRVLEKCGFVVSGEGSFSLDPGGSKIEEYILKLSQ
ncbi:MAG: N-acetyltransferase [Chloroflexota bacterium]|nr:MAG: N-acetyltransferase [Chloroflexota bacterium]